MVYFIKIIFKGIITSFYIAHNQGDAALVEYGPTEHLIQTEVHLCPSFHVVRNTGFPIINLASVHE